MLKKFLGWGLTSCILGLASLSGTALAIPALQLDVVDNDSDALVPLGGHYLNGTTFSASDTFKLYALFCPNMTPVCQPSNVNRNNKFYLTVALRQVLPAEARVEPPLGDLGSFMIDDNGTVNDQTIHVPMDMMYGVPNIAGVDEVQVHEIYPTFHKVFEFMFASSAQSAPYDVADPPLTDHQGPDGHPGMGMLYHVFNVDVRGLRNGPNNEIYDLHFDLSGVGERCTRPDPPCGAVDVLEEASSSHDAQGYRFEASQAIPEPSSLLLLGSGIAGLGLWWWRKRDRQV